MFVTSGQQMKKPSNHTLANKDSKIPLITGMLVFLTFCTTAILLADQSFGKPGTVKASDTLPEVPWALQDDGC